MDIYFKMFDQKRKQKGIELYNNNCECEDNELWKNIYSTLLLIEMNATTFDKHQLSEEIITFFENFEDDDFNLIEENDYEYTDDTFEDYDDQLIEILKNSTVKNDKLYSYVLDKIKYYNKKLDDLDLSNIFTKTLQYIKNPDCFFTNNDIIDLFEKDYDKALIEFNKIDNLKDIIYIYTKINNIDKINLLLNIIDNFISINDIYLIECLQLIISTSNNDEIIKKYGLIILENCFNFDIYNKIKHLCNKNELDEILNNIIKLNYINDDIFNILYENKLFKIIYDLIKVRCYNNNEIIKYCNIIIKDIPEEINTFIKNNIEDILNNKYHKYYHNAIEYLKMYKNNDLNNNFIEYSNNLLIKHNAKRKFKKLFHDEFKGI